MLLMGQCPSRLPALRIGSTLRPALRTLGVNSGNGLDYTPQEKEDECHLSFGRLRGPACLGAPAHPTKRGQQVKQCPLPSTLHPRSSGHKSNHKLVGPKNPRAGWTPQKAENDLHRNRNGLQYILSGDLFFYLFGDDYKQTAVLWAVIYLEAMFTLELLEGGRQTARDTAPRPPVKRIRSAPFDSQHVRWHRSSGHPSLEWVASG